MPNLYADPTETIEDVLPNVKTTNTEHVQSITRIIEAVSRFVDTFTDRPEGYFSAIGTDVSTKQKINIAVNVAGLLTNSTVRLTITAAGIPGSPIEIDVPATFGVSTNASIASAFVAAIAADQILSAFFNVTSHSGNFDLEIATAAPIDDTFAAGVAGVGAGTGVVATTSTVIEAGEYAVPASTRRYRGKGKNYLQIGRHVAGSATIPGTDSTLYYEHPENGWLYAVDNAAVAGVGGNDQYNSFDANFNKCFFAKDALYLVSARWGFASIPMDITMATKQIVQQIWDRGQGVIGEVTPSGFVVEREIPLTARAFLQRWVRREFEVN